MKVRYSREGGMWRVRLPVALRGWLSSWLRPWALGWTRVFYLGG